MLKNKELFVLVLVFVVIFGFIIPFIDKEKANKIDMPELDQQYIRVCHGYISRSYWPELDLSAADAKTVMGYINYTGRDWAKTDEDDRIKNMTDELYVVMVNIKQGFRFSASAEEDGTLVVFFSNAGENDTTETYKTTVKANVASRLLELLKGYEGKEK